MNSIETTRLSCPTSALRLWEAIAVIRHRKQGINFDRIATFVKKKYDMGDKETEVQLKKCVIDGLIIVNTDKRKYSRRRAQQECYILPHREKKSRHDWYCFECHGAGDGLMNCSSCHRVYHRTCIKDVLRNHSFQCFACKSLNDNTNLSQERLNYLLKYLLSSLKSICPVSLMEWDEKDWKDLPLHLIIFKIVDLSAIQRKILNSSYSQIAEVKVDVQNIVHNIFLCYGENSGLTKQVLKMLAVCEQMVKEIQLCPDCFLSSYEKKCKFWFCQPCQIPHQLVYAKVKGYPYWPAKVMEETDLHFNVRFFGKHHQQALVEKNYVLPITTNLLAVQKMPKTAAWDGACGELKCYQTLLENISNGFEKFSCYRRKQVETEKCDMDDIKRHVTVVEKNGLTDDEKLSIWTERSKHLSSVSREINREMLHSDMIPTCLNEVSYKQTSTSESQTHCIHHLHHKYISHDITKKEETKEGNMSSGQNDAQNSKNCYRPYEGVSLHMEANDLCPLNQLNSYCVPGCDVEKLKQRRIRTAICKVNRHYDNLVVRLAKEHCKILEYIKKKSWCSYCNKKAYIHCCWNTEYCSEHCQNKHWMKGHWKECKAEG